MITAALLAIVYKKRYAKKKVRRRATLDPFLDLDGEMVAVNQPLIIGDGPGPGGAVYSDPYTDDARPRTHSGSLSLTAPTRIMMMESNNTSRAVVGNDPSPTTDGRVTAESNDQHQPTDQLPPIGIAPPRSPQSLPQVQTQFPPEIPVPQPSISTFDAGTLAYLHYKDQTMDRNPPYLPENAEDPMLTSAFSVASELSPQYPVHAALNIDEAWRSSPDPIKASSSYRSPSLDRRHSFTPSFSGYEPEDAMVNVPLDQPAQDPEQGPPSPASEYSTSPQTMRGENRVSRPSPITEIVRMLSRSRDGSNDSETWISAPSEDSSPVVMTAKKVQVTRGPVSLSLTSPPYITSLGPSTSNRYGESLPQTEATKKFPRLPPPPGGLQPLPPLPQVQPLTLGKKRPAQGPS